MSHRFLLVDVFTDRPFGGNQLAVFPQADKIDEAHLQPMARELNFSETAYLYPPSKAESVGRLRIFTPDAEIPFAGHPVVGSVFAIEHEGLLPPECCDLKLELEGWQIPVQLLRGESGRLLEATMTQQRPVFLTTDARPEMAAHALGLSTRDIAMTGLPCEIVSTGLPVQIVPVFELDAMHRIQVHPAKLRELGDLLGVGDVFVFSFETMDPTANVHCRMFAPSYGIPEDAATGSAAGCLAAYLVKNRAVPPARLTRIVGEQGLEIGRPSRWTAEVESQGDVIRAVRVGGGAVVVGEGSLSA
jgi:trans-2,3-dihydro-3-hydroxyanthranilate isomerase